MRKFVTIIAILCLLAICGSASTVCATGNSSSICQLKEDQQNCKEKIMMKKDNYDISLCLIQDKDSYSLLIEVDDNTKTQLYYLRVAQIQIDSNVHLAAFYQNTQTFYENFKVNVSQINISKEMELIIEVPTLKGPKFVKLPMKKKIIQKIDEVIRKMDKIISRNKYLQEQIQETKLNHLLINKNNIYFDTFLNDGSYKIKYIGSNQWRQYFYPISIKNNMISKLNIKQVNTAGFYGIATNRTVGSRGNCQHVQCTFYRNTQIYRYQALRNVAVSLKNGQTVTIVADLIDNKIKWIVNNVTIASDSIPDEMQKKKLYFVIGALYSSSQFEISEA